MMLVGRGNKLEVKITKSESGEVKCEKIDRKVRNGGFVD